MIYENCELEVPTCILINRFHLRVELFAKLTNVDHFVNTLKTSIRPIHFILNHIIYVHDRLNTLLYRLYRLFQL